MCVIGETMGSNELLYVNNKMLTYRLKKKKLQIYELVIHTACPVLRCYRFYSV